MVDLIINGMWARGKDSVYYYFLILITYGSIQFYIKIINLQNVAQILRKLIGAYIELHYGKISINDMEIH